MIHRFDKQKKIVDTLYFNRIILNCWTVYMSRLQLLYLFCRYIILLNKCPHFRWFYLVLLRLAFISGWARSPISWIGQRHLSLRGHPLGWQLMGYARWPTYWGWGWDGLFGLMSDLFHLFLFPPVCICLPLLPMHHILSVNRHLMVGIGSASLTSLRSASFQVGKDEDIRRVSCHPTPECLWMPGWCNVPIQFPLPARRSLHITMSWFVEFIYFSLLWVYMHL